MKAELKKGISHKVWKTQVAIRKYYGAIIAMYHFNCNMVVPYEALKTYP